jgi:hypothetical protein
VFNEHLDSYPKYLRVNGIENPSTMRIQARGYDSQSVSRSCLVSEKDFRGELEQDIRRKVSFCSSEKSKFLFWIYFFDFDL